MTDEDRARELLDVTQEDRDAAAAYYAAGGNDDAAWRTLHPVTPQGGALAQAFARHRLSALRATRAAAVDREAVIAVLQSWLDGHDHGVLDWGAFADEILALLPASGAAPDAAAVDREGQRSAPFVGRKPCISKHRAIDIHHVQTVVDRLDASGDTEAADTLIWQLWWRDIDTEREKFLLADKQERINEQEALHPAYGSTPDAVAGDEVGISAAPSGIFYSFAGGPPEFSPTSADRVFSINGEDKDLVEMLMSDLSQWQDKWRAMRAERDQLKAEIAALRGKGE